MQTFIDSGTVKLSLSETPTHFIYGWHQGILEAFNILCKSLCLLAVLWEKQTFTVFIGFSREF